MNIKINKEQYLRLKEYIGLEFIFGSKMYGTDTSSSDTDILCFYTPPESWLPFMDTLPNNHQFQYDDLESNTQYIFTTVDQFLRNQASGDSMINTEIILFTDMFETEDKVEICRTYKIIKALLGFAKRDLKHKGRQFHVKRAVYLAEKLLNNELPSLSEVKSLQKEIYDINVRIINVLRERLNKLYETDKIPLYYIPRVEDSLLQLLLDSNNIKEFKY